MVLKKETTLFERDEEGELIPQEIELVIDEDDPEQKELEGESIFVIPMMRGEIKKMFSEVRELEEDRDLDGEIISKYCVKPEYTDEEIKYIKSGHVTAIVNTIFKASGIEVGKRTKKEAALKAEDDFAKNS